MRHRIILAVLGTLAVALSDCARAQGPTQPVAASAYGGIDSALGPPPGAPSAVGADDTSNMLIGRGIRRVPTSISRPPGVSRVALPHVEPLPPLHGHREQPRRSRFGALVIPPEAEEVQPAGGLTLDQAIDMLARENLVLRSKQLEIPQAQADVLGAGLRANPFVYMDGQLLPYGQYNPVTNPGGPAQYDVNVTLPFDWNLKRRARIAVAQRAQSVVEALYQNAVRLQVDELYDTYVDVLEARETHRLAKAAETYLQETLDSIKKRPAGAASQVELDQMKLQLDAAELALIDAEGALRTAKRRLATMLNMPPGHAAAIELSATIHDRSPPPPPLGQLVQLALAARADLIAFRLGAQRAAADVDLARANRFSDVYVLYQPYTYQNNRPFDLPSSRSWALGATVAVPLFDRNQGVIQRAQTNVEQTKLETRAQERIVVAQVEDAYAEYVTTRRAVERMEQHLLPNARQALDDNLSLYRQGQVPLLSYLNAQRDYGDLVRQYRDMLVRHRRSMLELNTAVGQRVLP